MKFFKIFDFCSHHYDTYQLFIRVEHMLVITDIINKVKAGKSRIVPKAIIIFGRPIKLFKNVIKMFKTIDENRKKKS